MPLLRTPSLTEFICLAHLLMWKTLTFCIFCCILVKFLLAVPWLIHPPAAGSKACGEVEVQKCSLGRGAQGLHFRAAHYQHFGTSSLFSAPQGKNSKLRLELNKSHLAPKSDFPTSTFQVPEVGRGNPGHSQRSHFWLRNKFSCFARAKLYHWEHQSFEQSLNISFILFCFSNLILQQYETLCNNTELGGWPLSSISFVYNQVLFLSLNNFFLPNPDKVF